MQYIQKPLRKLDFPSLCMTIAAAAIALGISPAHAAIQFFGVTKGQNFQQTSNAPPTTPSDLFGFMSLTSSNATDYTAAQVTTNDVVPSPISPFPLTPIFPGAFTFFNSYSTLSALDTDFPNNALYTFAISGGTLGSQSSLLLVPPSNRFPSHVPALSGSQYDQLQGMDSTAAFEFNWIGYTPAAGITTPSTFLSITNLSGDPGASWFISGDNAYTSQLLPGGSLLPGATYNLNLTYYSSIIAPDVFFVGADSIVAYSMSTDLVFTTMVPEPSSLALIGIGGVGLIGLSRLRRRMSVGRRRQTLCPNPTAILIVCLLFAGAATSTAKADFVYTHLGDTDPVTEGFTGFHIFGAPSTFGPIANDLGNPAWSITGTGQSSQYAFASGPLSPSELDDISTQGFTLTMTSRALQGIAPAYTAAAPVGLAGTSFSTGTQRFDIFLGLDINGDTVVFLPTSVDADGPGSSHQGHGPSYALAGTGNGYHTYTLVYDPITQLADLFVDGTLRIEDYAGNTTFITNSGLAFGAASGGQANHTFVQVVSVPEPSSLTLIGVGGLAFTSFLGRRHRSRRACVQ